MTSACVIRSGRHGERDAWALANGCSGGGWHEVPDLTPYTTREQVTAAVASAFGGAGGGRIANYAGQMWALRGRIRSGDLIVLPLKTTRQVALGRANSAYHHLADEADPDCRHVIGVDWIRTDVPRTMIKQDLLYTLGSAISIFAPTKNGAVARLEAILATGSDPGQGQAVQLPNRRHSASATTDDVDEPESSPDIEQAAHDQISIRIGEEFAGHDLATLVTGLLEADGLKCIQSPPGPDGGIDIVAGRGLLGLDDPILVQVKSGSQVGSPVVNQLHGVMASHGARQGLLVAWGGLTKSARDALRASQLRVRVWEAADVVDAVLANYDALSEEIRASLPLKRVWVIQDVRG